MVVMKSGRLMRKIFAAVLSLSLVLASAVSVSAAYLATISTGNNVADAKDIQFIGLGGVYDASGSVTCNVIIPGKFTDLKITNNGDEIEHSIKGPDENINNYRIVFSSSNIKYIGENLIKIVAYYSDGTTKTGQAVLQAHPKIGFNATTAKTPELDQNFDSLDTSFDSMEVANQGSAIKTGTATVDAATYQKGNLTNAMLEGNGSFLGTADNKVLKISGATSTTDIRYLQISPTSKQYVQILNFNAYIHGDDIGTFDVVLNNNENFVLDLKDLAKDTWHGVGIIYDQYCGTMTTYVDSIENVRNVSYTSNNLTTIRIRTQFGTDSDYVAIDNLKLAQFIANKLPGVYKMQYHTGDQTNRSDTINSVVPYGVAKGLVLNMTRGNGGTDNTAYSLYTLKKNGTDITANTAGRYRSAKPEYPIVVEYSDKSILEPGKYTFGINSDAKFGSWDLSGILRRNFYVTNSDGFLVLPGTQEYDGNTFNYNMEYAIDTTTASNKSLLVVAAIYDDNNKLEKVEVIPAPATGHEISGTLEGEGTKAALFVWDKDSLKPIGDGVYWGE